MQRDLQALEAYVLEWMDSLPDALFMVDPGSMIVLANPLAEKMFGYESGGMAGKTIDSLIPDRFRAAHSGHCADYFAKPRTRAMGAGLSLRALRKDGTEFPVEISLGPVTTSAGTVVIGTIRHIGESEERYRAIFEQVAVGVVHSDLDGRILSANSKFCEIAGCTRREAIARRVIDFTYPEDIEKTAEATKRLLGGTISEYARDTRLLAKDGLSVWTHVTTSLVRGIDRRPLHFITIIHDISGQKRAEEERIESEERFRAMVEQSISGACMVDMDGCFVYLNSRLLRILGYKTDEALVGRPVLDFVAPESHEVVRANIRERLAGDPKKSRYHFEAIRRDGTRVTLGAHANPGIFRGNPVLITTVQDVTELRRAEEEVERMMEKLKNAVQSTILVVSTIGEMRDPYTRGHERRVGEVASAIAVEMGLSEDRVEGVRIAGHLHDVGKIGVPAEILTKPTRLTALEFELIKQHPQQSYEILKGIEFLWPIAEACWQHHERMDGTGYPRGLKGDEIILEARVLAVADTVEAMASHRPYRPGLGIDKALAEIEGGRGEAFDPIVVDACLSLFRAKGYSIP